MGRSVSYPIDAIVVAYNVFEGEDALDFEWQVIEDLRNHAQELWPSLRECDHWLDREDHAVLENALAYVGVSEYDGVVAYWVVPKEAAQPLAERWCEQIAPRFEKAFGRLRPVGRFSNGERLFELIR
jgi:hypothetical protein